MSTELLNSVFSTKQVQRKFPIQAALHIVLDGALVGMLITVSIMSSVALHSQYLWTKSFTKLETTRDLNRRILESTSILESYLMKNQKLSRNCARSVPNYYMIWVLIILPLDKWTNIIEQNSKIFHAATSFRNNIVSFFGWEDPVSYSENFIKDLVQP